jgi:hypothetical protein
MTKKSSRVMRAVARATGEYPTTAEPVTTSAVMTPTVNAARRRLRSMSHLSKMATGIAARTAPVPFSSPTQVYTPTRCEGQMLIHQDGDDVNGMRSIEIDARK